MVRFEIKEFFFRHKKIVVSSAMDIEEEGSRLKEYILAYIEKVQEVARLVFNSSVQQRVDWKKDIAIKFEKMLSDYCERI